MNTKYNKQRKINNCTKNCDCKQGKCDCHSSETKDCCCEPCSCQDNNESCCC